MDLRAIVLFAGVASGDKPWFQKIEMPELIKEPGCHGVFRCCGQQYQCFVNVPQLESRGGGGGFQCVQIVGVILCINRQLELGQGAKEGM